MAESSKTEEFLQKLTPFIERGEPEACVEEGARLARELGIGAEELLDLSARMVNDKKNAIAYVLALVASQGLDGHYKAIAYNNVAISAQLIEKIQGAEEFFLKAIGLDSKYADAYFNYANFLLKLKRYQEAEIQYKISIEISPQDIRARNNYANLLLKLKRYQEAEEQYKKSIEIRPNEFLIHNNYGLFLIEQNRKNEAEEHFKIAIGLNPKYASAHNNYANLLRLNSMFSEAEKEVRIALQIEPDNPIALGTYGDILADEDNLEEAIEKYHEAIKNSDSMAHPAIAEIRNNLGWAYAHLERYNRAKKEFDEAHKLDPENVKAMRNLRALRKVTSEPKFSKTQTFLALVLILVVIATWYLFLNKMLSENIFAAQSTTLIALLIFILFYHQLGRFKAGPIEFEKSAEHRSQPSETLLGFERS